MYGPRDFSISSAVSGVATPNPQRSPARPYALEAVRATSSPGTWAPSGSQWSSAKSAYASSRITSGGAGRDRACSRSASNQSLGATSPVGLFGRHTYTSAGPPASSAPGSASASAQGTARASIPFMRASGSTMEKVGLAYATDGARIRRGPER